MAKMLKVKMPNLPKGWALLEAKDFDKPKPDGSAWELYEEQKETVEVVAKKAIEEAGVKSEEDEKPSPHSTASSHRAQRQKS